MAINVSSAQPQGSKKKALKAKDGQPHFWGAAIYDKPVDLQNSIKKKKSEKQNKRGFPQNKKFHEWELVSWVSITHIILSSNIFWAVWMYAHDYCKEGNFQVPVMWDISHLNIKMAFTAEIPQNWWFCS